MVLLPMFVSAALIFPSLDDGWAALLVKEEGVPALAASPSLRARPLFGYMLTGIWNSGVSVRVIGVVSNLGAATALATLTAILWGILFPDRCRLAAVAGCLAIAPVVALTQTTTLVTILPIHLPVLLSYSGVVFLLLYVKGTLPPALALGVGAALIAAGLVVSEYAMARPLRACRYWPGSPRSSAAGKGNPERPQPRR